MSRHAPLPRLRGNAGYSLIELITALVIVAVVMALATPSMSRMVTTYRTENAIEQIRNDLALTRMTAIRNGRSASLRVTSATGYSVTLDTSTTSTALAAQKLISQVNLGSKDYLVTLSPATTTITFNSRGLVSAGDGTLKVSRGGVTDSLTITAVGRIYRVH